MKDIKSAMSDYERYRKARAKLSKGNKRAVFKEIAERVFVLGAGQSPKLRQEPAKCGSLNRR